MPAQYPGGRAPISIAGMSRRNRRGDGLFKSFLASGNPLTTLSLSGTVVSTARLLAVVMLGVIALSGTVREVERLTGAVTTKTALQGRSSEVRSEERRVGKRV